MVVVSDKTRSRETIGNVLQCMMTRKVAEVNQYLLVEEKKIMQRDLISCIIKIGMLL